MRYINIHRLTQLPDVSQVAPFKTVIAVEQAVSKERQAEISTWLVNMGCRYVMACGENCDSWTKSIRQANLMVFDLGSMGAEDFVMATAHRYESLRAVFWYAKNVAKHPEIEFKECVVLHLANGEQSDKFQSMFQRA